jgi:hypothetical protein
LEIRVLTSQRWKLTQAAMRRVFQRYGLPEVIRVDNGMPFGSTGPAGLSRLSVWWMSLGIRVEYIDPGHPEQNGGRLITDSLVAAILAVALFTVVIVLWFVLPRVGR